MSVVHGGSANLYMFCASLFSFVIHVGCYFAYYASAGLRCAFICYVLYRFLAMGAGAGARGDYRFTVLLEGSEEIGIGIWGCMIALHIQCDLEFKRIFSEFQCCIMMIMVVVL